MIRLSMKKNNVPKFTHGHIEFVQKIHFVVTLCLALTHRACHIHGICRTGPASQVVSKQQTLGKKDPAFAVPFVTCP